MRFFLKDEIGSVPISQSDYGYLNRNWPGAWEIQDWNLLDELDRFVERLFGRKVVGHWSLEQTTE